MSDLQTSATLPTPGPWLVYEDSEIYSGEPSDELLATVYPMKRDGIHDSWKANARLIAAAPEMLEALEGVSSLLQEGFLVRDTRGDDKSDWAIKAFPKLRKLALVQEVIRKARGTE